MSRSLSTAAKAAIHAGQTDEALLFLVAISHASITTLRFVNNTEDVVSGGDTYSAYPFAVTLQDERDDQPPEVVLGIDNVTRAITDAIRALTSAPTVTLSVVLASSPSTIEAGPIVTTLRDATYDHLQVMGTLGIEQVLVEPYPGGTFDPRNFPALFG